MSVLPIVTYDDDVLRQEAKPIEENSKELQQFIEDMFETMYNSDGVGLAAPQVGKLWRLFVADPDPMTRESDEPSPGPLTMINPEIIYEGGEKVELDEGCLSIPGVNAGVVRHEEIKVTFLDRDFEEQELELAGWPGRVVQHEIDHLNGILFLDHLSFFKRKLLNTKLKEIAEGKKEIAYPVLPKKVS